VGHVAYEESLISVKWPRCDGSRMDGAGSDSPRHHWHQMLGLKSASSYGDAYQSHFPAWATHVSYTTLASASPSSLPSPTFASPTTPRSSPALTGSLGSNPCNPPLTNHTLLPLPA
jgi:hypothetical protein